MQILKLFYERSCVIVQFLLPPRVDVPDNNELTVSFIVLSLI